MPLRRLSQAIAARAVQVTAFDDLIVEYTLGADCLVRGIQITARPTAGVPTTAQLQGVSRVIAYKGIAHDPHADAMSVAGPPTSDGSIFLDGNFGMANLSGPAVVWCTPTSIDRGESFAVQVCRGVDTAGAPLDVDIALIPIVEIVKRATDTQGLVAV